MADANTFDQARAEAWATEVDAELDSVNKTLQEVAQECQESPYEDDVIFSTIMNVGRAFGEAWQGLTNQFIETVDGLHTVAKTIVNTVGGIIDGIASFITGKSY